MSRARALAQFATNILAGATSLAVFKDNLGIFGTKVLDYTVTGSPVTAVDINLSSFNTFEIITIIHPNGAVADFSPAWRVSTDGTAYASGASDYLRTYLAAAGNTTPTSVGGSLFSLAYMGSTVDTGFPSIASLTRALFYKGTTANYTRMQSHQSSFDGTNYSNFFYHSTCQVLSNFNFLRLTADVANAFGLGSRFIVRGF